MNILNNAVKTAILNAVEAALTTNSGGMEYLAEFKSVHCRLSRNTTTGEVRANAVAHYSLTTFSSAQVRDENEPVMAVAINER